MELLIAIDVQCQIHPCSCFYNMSTLLTASSHAFCITFQQFVCRLDSKSTELPFQQYRHKCFFSSLQGIFLEEQAHPEQTLAQVDSPQLVILTDLVRYMLNYWKMAFRKDFSLNPERFFVRSLCAHVPISTGQTTLIQTETQIPQIQTLYLYSSQLMQNCRLYRNFIRNQFLLNYMSYILALRFDQLQKSCLDIKKLQELIKLQSYMFEDNPFADQVNVYQHLEMYEDECWLQHMNQLSQQLRTPIPNSTNAHIFVENTISQETTYETLEFDPFDFERQTHRMGNETLQDQNQETVFPYSSIEADQFSSVTALTPQSNDLDQTERPQILNATYPKTKRSSGVSFNTTDYIIKHCFKKMLAENLRDQVEPICEAHHLSYSAFVHYWKQLLKKYAPNKHIGLTRFIKMIDETHPTAHVCRLFFSSYLKHEYPRYITVGSMHNKQEYLRCATKLMYISCQSKKGSKNILSARKI